MLIEDIKPTVDVEPSHYNPYTYQRRNTRVVMVGHIGVGGDNPIRIQSMTTTSTMDTNATVDQVKRLADVGCEIARITAPTINEARNLENIKNDLLKCGYTIPLVADIHFRPDAAMEAVHFVEKVRVNPGNYVDGKAFKVREYTDEQYNAELARLEEKFTPLVLKLKKFRRALRIGTNHGSLSDRIMNRFGDTPRGMVESALEFLTVCRKHDYHDVIFSMKASNPRVMIAVYRLLAERLDQEGMDYPFHLGVTEAGAGEDGRIKSAVGIGSLLEDGIGDTIRVSLTEDPEGEIPVAQKINERYQKRLQLNTPSRSESYCEDRFSFTRRQTIPVKSGPIEIGGEFPIRVLNQIDLSHVSTENLLHLLEERLKKDTPPEIIEIPFKGRLFQKEFDVFQRKMSEETNRLAFWLNFDVGTFPEKFTVKPNGISFNLNENVTTGELKALRTVCSSLDIPLILYAPRPELLLHAMELANLRSAPVLLGLVKIPSKDSIYAVRRLVLELKLRKIMTPLILKGHPNHDDLETAIQLGSLISDGMGDILSTTSADLSDKNLDYTYNLLQGCGSRLIKTEFVSCPSCGRTLFDLQSTTERIKSKTGHLKGVKIAIMGCIVNGPGEMADADFGYVGGGPGKINLYAGKTCVQKSIPTAMADDRLIDLIKSHGKWVDPA